MQVEEEAMAAARNTGANRIKCAWINIAAAVETCSGKLIGSASDIANSSGDATANRTGREGRQFVTKRWRHEETRKEDEKKVCVIGGNQERGRLRTTSDVWRSLKGNRNEMKIGSDVLLPLDVMNKKSASPHLWIDVLYVSL